MREDEGREERNQKKRKKGQEKGGMRMSSVD